LIDNPSGSPDRARETRGGPLRRDRTGP